MVTTPTTKTTAPPAKVPTVAAEPRVGTPATAAPVMPWSGAGAGTAAAQTALPRKVANPAGGWDDAAEAPPVLDHINPTTGAAGTDFLLQVFGTYATGAKVMVSGNEFVAAEVSGHLEFTYPGLSMGLSPGPKDVQIKNPDGQLSNTVVLNTT